MDKNCGVSHKIFVERRTLRYEKGRSPEIIMNYDDKYLFEYDDYKRFQG